MFWMAYGFLQLEKLASFVRFELLAHLADVADTPSRSIQREQIYI
jgi:hypothetical protein